MDSSQQSTCHLLCSTLFISFFRRLFRASASGGFLYEINNIFEYLSDREMYQSYSQGQTKYSTYGKKGINIIETKWNILKKTLSRLIWLYLDSPPVFWFMGTHVYAALTSTQSTHVHTHTQCFFTPLFNKVKMQRKIISDTSEEEQVNRL